MSIFAFSQEKNRIWTDGTLPVLNWTVLDVNIIIALSGFAKAPHAKYAYRLLRVLLAPVGMFLLRVRISQLTFLKAHNIHSIHGASPRFLPPKGWSPPPWLSRFRLKNNGSIRACRGFVSMQYPKSTT